MHSRQTTGRATNSFSTTAPEPRSSTPSTGAYTTEVSPRRLRTRAVASNLITSPISRNSSSDIPDVHSDGVGAVKSPQRRDFTHSSLIQTPSNASLLDSLLYEVDSVLENPQDPLPHPSSRSRPPTALAASRNASTRTHLRPQTPSSSHDLYSTLADLGYGAISPSVTPTATSSVPARVSAVDSPQTRPGAARLSSVDGCDVDSLIAHVYPRAPSAGAATAAPLDSATAGHGMLAGGAYAASGSHSDGEVSSACGVSVSPSQAWGSFTGAEGSSVSTALDSHVHGDSSGSDDCGGRRARDSDRGSGSDNGNGGDMGDIASSSWAAESIVKHDGACDGAALGAQRGDGGGHSGADGGSGNGDGESQPAPTGVSVGADACMLAAIQSGDGSAGGDGSDGVAEVDREGPEGEWGEDGESEGERDALSVTAQAECSDDAASRSTRQRVRARKRVTFASGASAVAMLSATDTLDSTTLSTTASTAASMDSDTAASVDSGAGASAGSAGSEAGTVAATSHAEVAIADTTPHALIATVPSRPAPPLVSHSHTPLVVLARSLPLLPSPEVTLAPSCARRYRPVRRLGQGAFGSVFLLAERVEEEDAYVDVAASSAVDGAGADGVVVPANAEDAHGAVPSQPQLHPSLLADASSGYLLRDADGGVWRCSAVLKRVVVEEESPVSFTHSALLPADSPAAGAGGETEAMQRALAEVQLMQSLQHPFVVHIHTHLVWRGCVDMVIEWARGGDLEREIRSAAAQEERWSEWYKEQRRKEKSDAAAAAQIAKSDGSAPALPAPAAAACDAGTTATTAVTAAPQPPRGRLSEERVCGWLAQIALAVYFIHSRRVLHRDIKTANIFLTANGDAKLGDFGAARALATSHDKAKTQIGTPYYLAPEICHGRPYGPACDVWSLGVVAYELCALKRPFVGGNIAILVMAIVGKDPAPLPKHYSAALRGLIARMLEKEPDKRANMEEVISHPVLRPQLHRILGIAPSPAPHAPTAKPARKKASAKDATMSGGSNAGGHTGGARVVRKKNEAKVDDGEKGKKKKKKKVKRRSNRTGTLSAVVASAAPPATPSGEAAPPRVARHKGRADVDGAAKTEGASAAKRPKRAGTGPVDGVVKKKKKLKKKTSTAAAGDVAVETGVAPVTQTGPTRASTASARTPRTHAPTPSSASAPASARTPLVPAPPSTPAPTRSRPVSARYVAAEAPTPSRASADSHGHGTATPSRPLPRLRPSAGVGVGGATHGGPSNGVPLPRVPRPPPRDSALAPAASAVPAHPRARAVRGGGVTGTGSVRVVATQSHSPTRDARKPPVPSHVIGAGRAKAKIGGGAPTKAKTATVSREPARGNSHAVPPTPSAQPPIVPSPPAVPPSSRPPSAASSTSRAARMQARALAEPLCDNPTPDARTATPTSTTSPAPEDSATAVDAKSAPAHVAAASGKDALCSSSISPALSHTFAPALAAALGAVSATAAAGTAAAVAGEAEGRWLGSSVVVDARALAYIQAIARELKNTGVSVLGKWRRSRERRRAQQSGAEAGENADVADGAGVQGDGASSPSTPTRNTTAAAATPSLTSAQAPAAMTPTVASSPVLVSPGLPRSPTVPVPATAPNQPDKGFGVDVGVASAEAVASPTAANTARGHVAGSADALGVTGVPEAIDLSQTALALNRGLGGGYGGEEVEEVLAATLGGAEDDEDAFIAQHARKAVAAAVAVAAAEEEEEGEEEEGAYSEDWGDEDEEEEEDAENDENDEDDEDEDEYSDDYESGSDDGESEFSYDDDDDDEDDDEDAEEDEEHSEEDGGDDEDDGDEDDEEEEGELEEEEGAEVPEDGDGDDEDFDEVEEVED